MIDRYLRFDSEAAFSSLQLVSKPGSFDINVIGIIELPTGRINGDGAPILAPIPGWHVNLRCLPDTDLDSLSAFIVTPEHPQRVWAPLISPRE